MTAIWSSTDFPYMCLKDRVRTDALREAIVRAVRPGDIVLDLGAGTGILALSALRAGAARAYVAEIDPLLCTALRATAQANGYADRLIVVEGDARDLTVPEQVDVVLSEMIDTGLVDEMQVPVLNRLRARGVIGADARVIPAGYETYLDLVHVNNKYYDFTIHAPMHEWPFYAGSDTWHQTPIQTVTTRQKISSVEFHELVDEEVDATVVFRLPLTGNRVNAVRLSGVVLLDDRTALGPTNALNGDKLFVIEPIDDADEVSVRCRYRMGEGLAQLSFDCVPVEKSVQALTDA